MKSRKNHEAGIKQFATGKGVAFFTLLTLIGILLLVIAASDLFTKSVFQKEYTFFYLLISANAFFVAKLWRMYLNREK